MYRTGFIHVHVLYQNRHMHFDLNLQLQKALRSLQAMKQKKIIERRARPGR